MELCQGQCYDGASVMSGTKSGVAATISSEEPRAVFTHCYRHSLNFTVGDTVRQRRLMKSALETVSEISKLIKKSPKRDAMFQNLKHEIAQDCPGFRVLCPTRWTVRAASKESRLDSNVKARIIVVDAQMQT